MAAAAENKNSTRLIGDNQRNRIEQEAINLGFNPAWARSSATTNDELLAALQTAGSDAYQRSQRTLDRQDSMTDFRAQLADLTASKQRQAEQAGRIAQNNTRSQGLAQMMSNF
jgi:hypothetical protein